MKSSFTRLLVAQLVLLMASGSLLAGGPETDPGTQSAPLNIEMVEIPAGDLEWEASATRHAMTIHLESFLLGKYEVTQRLWKEVMGTYPAVFVWDDLPIEYRVEGAVSDRGRELTQPTGFLGDDLPAEAVSWDMVQDFLAKLSEKTGKTYRLPTRAEWEYACHAGTETTYYFGDDATQLADYEWFEANSEGKPHPVGQKKPNPWGLYDMAGNVGEWTSTIADMAPYEKLYPGRDFGPGISRVYKGSHYLHTHNPAQCGYGHTYQEALPRGPVGFRLVREE